MRTTYTIQMLARGVLALILVAGGLAACAITPQMDISKYVPVVDVPADKRAQFQSDLGECRVLGIKAQATYKSQRLREVGETLAAAAIGTLVGGGLGAAIGDSSSSSATGAVAGGLVGASAASGNVHHTRDLAKLGPTVIVDRCMAGRGYRLLNTPGLGGG